MLIAAALVGLVAAYYFGIQAGIWAAAATAVLVVGTMIPGLALYAYAAMGVGVAALVWLGPKLRRKDTAAGALFTARRAVDRAIAAVRTVAGPDKPTPGKRAKR
jgi:hypothetical protein